MAKQDKEKQEIKERIYTIPLRKEWHKVPQYKRAKKAMKAIREFIVRHMRVTDEEVKIDSLISEAVWTRGIKHPPHKITVKVKKKDDVITVEFAALPKKFKAEDKKFKKKQKKLEEIKKVRDEKKKKAEEERAKKDKEKEEQEKDKEKDKSAEEKHEEKEDKEKDKILKNAPIEKTHEFVKPTKADGGEHRREGRRQITGRE